MHFWDSADALGRWLSRAEHARVPAPPSAATRFRQPEDHWFTQLVAGADVYLRRWYGVREFTARRTCIFRIAPGKAPHDVVLGCGRTIRAGDPVVELHLWNEHFLRIPADGPDLVWGKLMRKRFRDSLFDIALYMEDSPEMTEVVAIWARDAIPLAKSGRKLARICECYGFEVLPMPERSALEKFVGWFIDFWVVILVMAFNPRSLSADLLFRPRYELWMSREVLFRRFGRYGADQPRISPYRTETETLIKSATGTASTTPGMPKSTAPDKKQKITIEG